MDIAIGGNIEFILADDGDTTNGTNIIGQSIPVALILEQYNPEIFYCPKELVIVKNIAS